MDASPDVGTDAADASLDGSGGMSGSGGGGFDASLPDVPVDPCDAPAAAGDSALCLEFRPETIAFESDPALDGLGTLLIQVFDTPTPPPVNASSAALIEQTVTADGGGDLDITALPPVRIEGTLPSSVFLRVLFADNATRSAPEELTYGTWFGGMEFDPVFDPSFPGVPVLIGQGRTVVVPLRALRRLDLTVSASATPIGDGAGPLEGFVFSGPDFSMFPAVVGRGTSDCEDVSGAMQATIQLPFFGNGTLWPGAYLNDLGEPVTSIRPPEGSLASLVAGGDGGSSLVLPTSLDVPSDAYTASATLDLGHLEPFSGVPGPNACTDINP